MVLAQRMTAFANSICPQLAGEEAPDARGAAAEDAEPPKKRLRSKKSMVAGKGAAEAAAAGKGAAEAAAAGKGAAAKTSAAAKRAAKATGKVEPKVKPKAKAEESNRERVAKAAERRASAVSTGRSTDADVD